MMSRWLSFLILLPIVGVAEDRLQLLDGSFEEGVRIQSIDSASGLILEGSSKATALENFRGIYFGDARGNGAPGKSFIELGLVGGGLLRAREMTLENEQVAVDWNLDPELVLPIEVFRSIRFKPGVSDAVFEAAVVGSNDNDQVFLDLKGEIRSVEGLIESISAESLVMEIKGKKRKVGLAKVFGVVLADFGGAAKASIKAALRDGSVLPVKSFTLKGHTFDLLPMGSKTPIRLSREEVAAITIDSPKLKFLSDLEPVDVQQETLLAPAWEWQRDHNLSGAALALGGQTYLRGISMKSGTRLTYMVPKEFSRFNALVGLDDSTRGHGNCVFVVLGDDKELYRKQLTGRNKPASVSLKLAGVSKLVVQVEYGEELDLSDHAIWADAAFVR